MPEMRALPSALAAVAAALLLAPAAFAQGAGSGPADLCQELLAFAEDSAFFPPNASAGRRRRLRSLQNAIAKALE